MMGAVRVRRAIVALVAVVVLYGIAAQIGRGRLPDRIWMGAHYVDNVKLLPTWQQLAEKIQSKGFVVGSVVAPVWPPTGGGSAMGNDEERKHFVEQVRKACRIARRLRELGTRPYGVVRIDSAAGAC